MSPFPTLSVSTPVYRVLLNVLLALDPVTDPPHWQGARPFDPQDTRIERRQGLDCAKEDSGEAR
jgi:hypothetical protein